MQVRGTKELPIWSMEVPSTAISPATRREVERDAGPLPATFSLSYFRSWAPGMALGRSFASGPNPTHEAWHVYVSWTAYLKLVIEVLSHLHGVALVAAFPGPTTPKRAAEGDKARPAVRSVPTA